MNTLTLDTFHRLSFAIDRLKVMIVKTQCKGRAFTGVEIGASSVRRYFPREIDVIELHLDHLLIQLKLAPGFWEDRARIADPRLSVWLELKNFGAQPGDEPAPLELIPVGKNCFRLQAIARGEQAKLKAVSEPATASIAA